MPGPGSLIAVVGPNGCGKSVVGEAIAFALGGNKKMLRASNLGALINQQRAAAGHRDASVRVVRAGWGGEGWWGGCMQQGRRTMLTMHALGWSLSGDMGADSLTSHMYARSWDQLSFDPRR